MIGLNLVTPQDTDALFELMGEMAAFEKIEDQLTISREEMARLLFEMNAARALLLTYDGELAGYVMYYFNISSFSGRGLFLEDVYVREQFRGKGIGTAVFEYLERTAHDEGCVRLEWICLDWNENALRFYDNLGAKPREGWTILRKPLI